MGERADLTPGASESPEFMRIFHASVHLGEGEGEGEGGWPPLPRPLNEPRFAFEELFPSMAARDQAYMTRMTCARSAVCCAVTGDELNLERLEAAAVAYAVELATLTHLMDVHRPALALQPAFPWKTPWGGVTVTANWLYELAWMLTLLAGVRARRGAYARAALTASRISYACSPRCAGSEGGADSDAAIAPFRDEFPFWAVLQAHLESAFDGHGESTPGARASAFATLFHALVRDESDADGEDEVEDEDEDEDIESARARARYSRVLAADPELYVRALPFRLLALFWAGQVDAPVRIASHFSLRLVAVLDEDANTYARVMRGDLVLAQSARLQRATLAVIKLAIDFRKCAARAGLSELPVGTPGTEVFAHALKLDLQPLSFTAVPILVDGTRVCLGTETLLQ